VINSCQASCANLHSRLAAFRPAADAIFGSLSPTGEGPRNRRLGARSEVKACVVVAERAEQVVSEGACSAGVVAAKAATQKRKVAGVGQATVMRSRRNAGGRSGEPFHSPTEQAGRSCRKSLQSRRQRWAACRELIPVPKFVTVAGMDASTIRCEYP
jgi:hypothetical protein